MPDELPNNEFEDDDEQSPNSQLLGEDEENDENQPQNQVDNIFRRQKPATPAEQIEQSQEKVPEFEYQPPAAEEPLPGGPAVETKKPPEKTPEQLEKEITATKKKIAQNQRQEQAENTLSSAWQNLKQKFTREAVKEVTTQAWKWLAASTSEYWLPILLGLIAVILLIIAIVFLVRAFQTPNANGSSPVEAADIVADHPLLKSVLALSNPADFQNMLADNKNKLTDDINNFESELKSKYPNDSRTTTTISQLEQVKTLIAAYSTPDATKAEAIKSALAKACEPWTVTLKPGGMIFPAGNGYSAKNITGGGKYNPTGVGGRLHGGIDVGMPIGTPLYAAASGTVKYLVDNNQNYGAKENHSGDDSQNGGFGNIIIVQMDTPIQTSGGTAAFWECHHLSPGSAKVKVGDHVNQGDLIAASGHNGDSSAPHLHFEVDSQYCNGSCNTKSNISKTINPLLLLGW